ncbi:MAG: hypothetical protein WC943_01530 [Elusimicrobiota bacterium]|jgi:hypothetical protein
MRRPSTSFFLTLLPALLCAGQAWSAVLFSDDFKRPDSGDPGPAWIEYEVRRADQGVPRRRDTAWSIKDGALHYEAVGAGSYIEDFIQTSAAFPAGDVKLEFDLKAEAHTSQGYVGPSVFLAPEAKWRTGPFHLVAGAPGGLIGAEAWYRWENGGTKGVLVFTNGGQKDFPEAYFGGLNDSQPSRHVIMVKDGKVRYSSSAFPLKELALETPLGPDAKRHLSFGVRLYDQGVPQVVDIDNIRLTSLAPEAGSSTDVPVVSSWRNADFNGTWRVEDSEKSKSGDLELQGSGPRLTGRMKLDSGATQAAAAEVSGGELKLSFTDDNIEGLAKRFPLEVAKQVVGLTAKAAFPLQGQGDKLEGKFYSGWVEWDGSYRILKRANGGEPLALAAYTPRKVTLSRKSGRETPEVPVQDAKPAVTGAAKDLAEEFLRTIQERTYNELERLMSPSFKAETSSGDFVEFRRELKTFGAYTAKGFQDGDLVILGLQNDQGRKAVVHFEIRSGKVETCVAKWGIQ